MARLAGHLGIGIRTLQAGTVGPPLNVVSKNNTIPNVTKRSTRMYINIVYNFVHRDIGKDTRYHRGESWNPAQRRTLIANCELASSDPRQRLLTASIRTARGGSGSLVRLIRTAPPSVRHLRYECFYTPHRVTAHLARSLFIKWCIHTTVLYRVRMDPERLLRKFSPTARCRCPSLVA